ncbi:hypothetical protein D3C71_1780930 [compost metagenome]
MKGLYLVTNIEKSGTLTGRLSSTEPSYDYLCRRCGKVYSPELYHCPNCKEYSELSDSVYGILNKTTGNIHKVSENMFLCTFSNFNADGRAKHAKDLFDFVFKGTCVTGEITEHEGRLRKWDRSFSITFA